MDNLKKYLQQHRDDMDMDEPGETLWENIRPGGKAKPAKNKVVPMIVRYAAAAAVITGIVIGVKRMNENDRSATPASFATLVTPSVIAAAPDKYDSVLVAQTTDITTAGLGETKTKHAKKEDKRYELMNSFRENYSQLVNYQLSSIRNTPVYGENQEYFDDFKTRLSQMDVDELSIRRNIRQNGISNVLIEQLINVYQQKLDVLKSLQSEINKMNTRVQQNHPSEDSLQKFYLNI
jgi:hypothetical protein